MTIEKTFLFDPEHSSRKESEHTSLPVHPENERVIEDMFRRLLGDLEKPPAALSQLQALSEPSAAPSSEPVFKFTRLTTLPEVEAQPLEDEPLTVFEVSVVDEAPAIETQVVEVLLPEAEPTVEAAPVVEPAGEKPQPFMSLSESARALGAIVLAAAPVLGIAAGLRLWDFSQQSAYMDEANYIVTGRTLLEQGKVYANALQWTFGSFLYPILAGLFDQQGGLVAARGLSLVFSLVTVLATIFLTLGLFKAVPQSREQARADYAIGSKPVMASLLAGLVVAVLPTVIALGRFATYDAMAAGLFAAGCAAFVWSRREANAETKRTGLVLALFGLAALFLFGAFLTKYVVALYFPALCLLVLFSGKERGKGFISFVTPMSAACLVYFLMFSTDLTALLHFGGQYDALKSNDLLREYVWNRPELLLLMLVGYWGFRQSLRDGRFNQALLLWGGVVLLVAFQFITRADYDYWKHSIYLIIFLAPLAGWLWSDWSWWDEPSASHAPGKLRRWWEGVKGRANPARRPAFEKFEFTVSGDEATERPGSYSLMATLLVLLLVAGIFWAQPNAAKLVSHWPSITPALPQIQEASQGASSVLVDDSALVYYLYGRVPTENVITPFFNNYKGQKGLAAYRQAVQDQQYSLVILDGGATDEGKTLFKEIRPLLEASPAYEQIFSQPLDSTNLSEKHSLEIYRLLSPLEQRDPTRQKPVTTPAPATTPAAATKATPAATPKATATPEAKAPATTVAATQAPKATATPVATATPTPAPVKYPEKPTYDFANGDEGWGALPATGGLQPGMAVTSSTEYTMDGHASLKFTPQAANKLYTAGVNRTGDMKKIKLYVFIPADKAGGDVRMGLYYFDKKWGWNDDGFQTKVVPGRWTELSWELPNAQAIQQFGLKVVGFSGSIYINGVTIE